MAVNMAFKELAEAENIALASNKRKMRICIITFFYKPAGGGIPRYVENITKKLSELGHSVDILTVSYNGIKVERENGVRVFRLPCLNIFEEIWRNKDKAREFIRFLRIYSRKKPDVFVAQNLHAAINASAHVLALNSISLEKEIPMILTTHAFVGDSNLNDLKIQMMKNLFWDKIVSVGSNLAESLLKHGILYKDIKVIYPPVDTEKFKPNLGKKWLRSRINISEKDFLILHASRLDSHKVAEEKGIFTLLKAFSLIKEKDIKLLISAAPTSPAFEKSKEETIEKIRETSKLFNIEKRVIIQTFDPDEMQLVYNGADLFVMATKIESFGMVYAEALACGIPVIGTTVGGVPEIIESGRTGELVNPEDHVELSRKINYLFLNEKKRIKMGAEGRKTITEKFEIGRICRALAGVYESVLKKPVNAKLTSPKTENK